MTITTHNGWRRTIEKGEKKEMEDMIRSFFSFLNNNEGSPWQHLSYRCVINVLLLKKKKRFKN